MDPASVHHAVLLATALTSAVSALVQLLCAMLLRARLFSGTWFALWLIGFVATVLGYIFTVHLVANWHAPPNSHIWADPQGVVKLVPLLAGILGAAVGGMLAS